MWLTGRLVPDHKTIADFRKDNGPAIKKVCARFVELCRKIPDQASVRSKASQLPASLTEARFRILGSGMGWRCYRLGRRKSDKADVNRNAGYRRCYSTSLGIIESATEVA